MPDRSPPDLPTGDRPAGEGAPVRLPGVGHRFDVRDADGRPVHVVRRRDGHAEIGAAGASIDLDPASARAVGAFLAGRFAMPPAVAERIDDALGSLVVDWVSLAPGDAAVGRSIADLEVRRRTGVTIVAVLRGSVPLVAPEPTLLLEAGDDLVVACRPGDLEEFVAVMRGSG